MSFDDFNNLHNCKAGPVEFPATSMLTQRVSGTEKYHDACIYFSAVDAVMMAGYKTDGYFSDLSGFVNSTRGNYTDIIKQVFGLDATYNEIPAGLDEKSLVELIGNNPAVLIYNQDDFWQNNKKDVKHGLAFYNDEFFEPYYGNKSKRLRSLGGKGNECLITSYTGGFYFEINKKED